MEVEVEVEVAVVVAARHLDAELRVWRELPD